MIRLRRSVVWQGAEEHPGRSLRTSSNFDDCRLARIEKDFKPCPQCLGGIDPSGDDRQPLFPNNKNRRLRRDAVAWTVEHASQASRSCPSLSACQGKKNQPCKALRSRE